MTTFHFAAYLEFQTHVESLVINRDPPVYLHQEELAYFGVVGWILLAVHLVLLSRARKSFQAMLSETGLKHTNFFISNAQADCIHGLLVSVKDSSGRAGPSKAKPTTKIEAYNGVSASSKDGKPTRVFIRVMGLFQT